MRCGLLGRKLSQCAKIQPVSNTRMNNANHCQKHIVLRRCLGLKQIFLYLVAHRELFGKLNGTHTEDAADVNNTDAAKLNIVLIIFFISIGF